MFYYFIFIILTLKKIFFIIEMEFENMIIAHSNSFPQILTFMMYFHLLIIYRTSSDIFNI